ncbi:MAG: hypothetical protein KKC80_00660 [Candidatus Margulisbacteria bacterium]|nr:hypothetical protein [Candidatus Margulisiibacteriota bacterium]MBU1616642.1 hypothetical protein [Candidatus Margulisiibacteriota bacterium]
MKKLLISLIVLVFCGHLSFANDTEYVVITKGHNINIYNEKGDYVGDVNANEAYVVFKVEKNDLNQTLAYWFYFNNNIASIEADKAGMLKKYDNKEMQDIYDEFYKSINSVNRLDTLKKEYKKLIAEYKNRDLTFPSEYYLAPYLAILNRINFCLKDKLNERLGFYNEIRKFLLLQLKVNDVDRQFHSKALMFLVGNDVSGNNQNSLSLAKEAFELDISQESADLLLSQLALSGVEEPPLLISNVVKYMSNNWSSNLYLANYYELIGNDDNAIKYYLIAEEKVSENYKVIFDVLGTPKLAKLLFKKEQYVPAAQRYLHLGNIREKNYYFDAALSFAKALEKGDIIEGIDIYRLIEFYKKSDMPDGYYNAGLLYIEMGSPRNARMIANELKKKFNEIEKANILFDEADKLDARLKGHNP